jgi:exportin-T
LVNAYVEKILNTIQDLLIIWDPSLTIDEINLKLNFSDDQLFLYETISILIVTCNLDLNLKSQLMKSLLSPIMNSFFNLLNKYLVTVDENEKLILAKCLNNEMLVASRTSKGFSNAVKVKDCQCTELFLQLLQQFLPALNIQTHKNLINAGVRQYLHRMVVCLDNEIFEYLPLSIESFVNNSDAKDLNDFIPLLTQIIAKFKQQIFNFLQKIFMQICNNILNVLFSNLASNDVHVVQEATVLQKSYYQFLLAIINNELINVIIYQGKKDERRS